MINSLNGWERIGVILSGVWLITLSLILVDEWIVVDDYRLVTFGEAPEMEPAKFIEHLHKEFRFVEWYNPKLEKYFKQPDACNQYCTKSYSKDEEWEKKYECWLQCEKGPKRVAWISFLSVVLIPLIGGWFGAYSLIWLLRWVIAGFKD